MFAILKWVYLNLASILGAVQAILKGVKEVLTAVLNLLGYPFFANKFGKYQEIVVKVRDVVNRVDDFVEKIKNYLIDK